MELAAGGDLAGEGGVGDLEVEDDGLLVRGLDALDGGQQRRGARGVGDLEGALEGELDVFRGELVAVGEGEAVAQGAAVDGAAGGEAALVGGLGLGLGAALGEGHEGLEDVVEQQPGAGVVAGRRVGGDDLVGHADAYAVAGVARAALLGAAAAEEGGGQTGGEGAVSHLLCVFTERAS